MDKLAILRHKAVTVVGALVAIFGILVQPDVLNLLPPKVGHAIVGVGGVLTILGRSIIAPTNSPPTKGDEQ